MPYTDKERQIFQRLKDDYPHYASRCLYVRPKDALETGLVKFIFNRAQIYIHERLEQQKRETGMVRALILKGRQQGCSTYVGGRFYHKTTHHFGARTFILTHADYATSNLFTMVKRFHEKCPEAVRPQTSATNARELVFNNAKGTGLNSGYALGTAGNANVGRSDTVQFLHGSEVAFWQHAAEHAKGIMQTVPRSKGTEIILESTANGVGNYFHQQWQMAEIEDSEFIAIFVPWFWQEEYSVTPSPKFKRTGDEEDLVELYGLNDGQLMWRRLTITAFSAEGKDGVKAFQQEYPCTAKEAFVYSGDDLFIAGNLVDAASHCKAEAYGPLVIGVDPARMGNDRTAIIRRQGRWAGKLEYHAKKLVNQVVGICSMILNTEKPALMCIDACNLGCAIYDFLIEEGHSKDIVRLVNAGGSPTDGKRYLNKRAENWDAMREWLADQPAQIPQDNVLAADLCAPKFDHNSKSQLMIEGKETMKKRGIRSPDGADALAVTFAFPNIAVANAKQTAHTSFGQQMAQSSRNFDKLKQKAYRD